VWALARGSRRCQFLLVLFVRDRAVMHDLDVGVLLLKVLNERVHQVLLGLVEVLPVLDADLLAASRGCRLGRRCGCRRGSCGWFCGCRAGWLRGWCRGGRSSWPGG